MEGDSSSKQKTYVEILTNNKKICTLVVFELYLLTIKNNKLQDRKQ